MTRVKQASILLLGLVLCAVMVVLGLWQKQVYENSGAQAAAEREAQPPLVLTQVAPPSQPVSKGFGRSVTFTGTYLAHEQLLVPTGDGYRVLTPLLQANGSVVPVVRGTVPTAGAPAPPSGTQHQVGVLAASEAAADQPASLPADQINGVQLSVLAQRWRQPMIGGYVTLTPDEAHAQGLGAATAQLPHNDGRFRNGAYALQWWVFAAFAIAFAIKIARDLGRRDLLADESAAQAAAPSEPASEPTDSVTKDPGPSRSVSAGDVGDPLPH